jgi:uncharacterized protein (DUF1015 family)
MKNHRQILSSLGIEVPSILLPNNINLQKWSVIACDQFTQDRGYWEKIKEITAGAPSTLNMIFPEVYLEDGDAQKRITDIHSTMKNYLDNGVFGKPQQSLLYIERNTPFNKKRRGLIAAIDLEQYDWHPESRPLIRSTEGTVEERLPPRMDIRRDAPLELPHVLLLIDDDTDSLLPALGEYAKKNAPVYDTPLMMDSGNVTGWLLDEEKGEALVAEKLEELFHRSTSRYNDSKPFLFAVGDGNHSLAAAKGIWEEHKKSDQQAAKLPYHPCRYALVEIENIYDPAIQFEPIHRIVFDIAFDEIVSLLSKLPDFSSHSVNNAQELSLACKQSSSANCFGIVCKDRYVLIETSAKGIATACLQPLLDADSRNFLIDYIHDDDELFRLAAAKDRLVTGILLPPIQKAGLFETVARFGPLPRKSFSIGHSCEKRFYFECRILLS